MSAPEETPAASLLDIPIARPEPAPESSAPTPEPAAATGGAGETAVQPPAPANDTRVAPDQPGAAASEPTPEAGPARNLPTDLYAYWRRLARDGMADADALDAGAIAQQWPYALLLRGRLDAPLDIVRVFRPAAGGPSGSGSASHPLAGDLCSQVSSWALAMARDCVVTGEPAVDVERFVLGGMARNYRGLALPCRRGGERWTYVLLYLHAMSGGRTT